MTDKIWRLIVKLLPRRLIYFATIKLGVEATTGKYSTTIVPELTFMDALKRFKL